MSSESESDKYETCIMYCDSDRTKWTWVISPVYFRRLLVPSLLSTNSLITWPPTYFLVSSESTLFVRSCPVSNWCLFCWVFSFVQKWPCTSLTKQKHNNQHVKFVATSVNKRTREPGFLCPFTHEAGTCPFTLCIQKFLCFDMIITTNWVATMVNTTHQDVKQRKQNKKRPQKHQKQENTRGVYLWTCTWGVERLTPDILWCTCPSSQNYPSLF